MKAGDCLHCRNRICDERAAYQNYICPYTEKEKCSCFYPVSEEMERQFKEHKIVTITPKNLDENGYYMDDNLVIRKK